MAASARAVNPKYRAQPIRMANAAGWPCPGHCGTSMQEEPAERKNDRADKNPPPPPPALSEKQRRELWLYIAATIAAVELLVLVGALFYGFLGAGQGAAGRGFAFPWLHWAAMAVVVPALILLLVHFADVGLFGARAGADADQEWQRHLPERAQRLYRIVKGAPAAAILLAIVAMGAALMTIDGALGLVLSFAAALKPHIPYIVISVAALLAVVALAAVWLNFRTRRLIAEYQFRREVLEKTGVIIVDKGSTALPPGGLGDVPYILVSGEEKNASPAALPAGSARPGDEPDPAPEKNSGPASEAGTGRTEPTG